MDSDTGIWIALFAALALVVIVAIVYNDGPNIEPNSYKQDVGFYITDGHSDDDTMAILKALLNKRKWKRDDN